MSDPRFIIKASERTGMGLSTFDLQRIHNILMTRGMILLPSDTGYAIAALPVEKQVYKNINTILSRGEEPMSLSFNNMKKVEEFVFINNSSANLLENFTPGPLTLICPVRPDENIHEISPNKLIQEITHSTDGTIGVRIPDSIIEREVASCSFYPITSAAVRDSKKATVQDFSQALEIVSKGFKNLNNFSNWAAVEGSQFLGEQSTVVSIDELSRQINILRKGIISLDDLKQSIDKYSLWTQFNMS